ncbi:LytR/AlgR family response regulator transcription factor [Xanthomonas bonasiae]|uniref:LytR/AlgR family response regulator transcription factor n=1 Tax=Xanthomonas bonasiae TaxID=2810351 RepID=UPI00197ED49F|nr:LytTR family DNA-binding domain-containing protein [Xanthomonas bonasiae]MBN6112541.1 response regulator transcription factor [Xanthomonas bonasiae]
MPTPPSALIADDEPLLREALKRQLARLWPELQIAAEARNGRDAVRLFEERQPQICFLDIQMPGLSGVQAAQQIGRRAHIVFVTAYDDYAVQAFAEGALDYLVKPVQDARLADTVERLQQRLQAAQPAADIAEQLRRLAAQLLPPQHRAPLRWLHAQAGNTLRLIPVEAIDYLRSDSKYTCVAWRNEAAQACEAIVATPLKELAAQLDPACFLQVHRSVVVNLHAIEHLVRHDNETAQIHLRGRRETLPVSRSYLPLFRAM